LAHTFDAATVPYFFAGQFGGLEIDSSITTRHASFIGRKGEGRPLKQQ